MNDPAKAPVDLDPNSILIAEYQYIAQTAFQANEDRSRVSTFYLVSVASFIAAVFTTLDDGVVQTNFIWAFFFLFAGLSLYGLFTLLQLARLRNAWYESVGAMNRIKDYYIQHPGLPDLEAAFAWRGRSMPPKLKLTSVTFLSALQIAVLACIMAGTAAAYWALAMEIAWLPVAAGIGLAFFIMQMVFFWWMLRMKK